MDANVFMDEELIALLPEVASPQSLYISDKLPCHTKIISQQPIANILKQFKRQQWSECLYARQQDVPHILRYQNTDGSWKQDFDENTFRHWIAETESNVAICHMEHPALGKGVFVMPGKVLRRGTFIISSGIIQLYPSREDLATKVHCSALQNLHSMDKTIYGLINPAVRGGFLDFVNHAPNPDELDHFVFQTPTLRKNVATANLRSRIRFFQGYAVMGVEATEDISGGEFGRQLLWSYALPDEYLAPDDFLPTKKLFLFDARPEHAGEVIDPTRYFLKTIQIYFDTGDMLFHPVSEKTRWEILESHPDERLCIATEDPYSTIQGEKVVSPISYGFLQEYLRQNPGADRIILQVPSDKHFEMFR